MGRLPRRATVYWNTEWHCLSLRSKRSPGCPERGIGWQSVARDWQMLWPPLQARRARGAERSLTGTWPGRASPGVQTHLQPCHGALEPVDRTAVAEGQRLWQPAVLPTLGSLRAAQCPRPAPSHLSSAAPLNRDRMAAWWEHGAKY